MPISGHLEIRDRLLAAGEHIFRSCHKAELLFRVKSLELKTESADWAILSA
jgi:hypothetical protein